MLITFQLHINANSLKGASLKPDDFVHLQLVESEYASGGDIIAAWDISKGNAIFYIGIWKEKERYIYNVKAAEKLGLIRNPTN